MLQIVLVIVSVLSGLGLMAYRTMIESMAGYPMNGIIYALLVVAIILAAVDVILGRIRV